MEFVKNRHSIDEFSDIAKQNRRGNYEKVTSETRTGIIGKNSKVKNTEQRNGE